MWLSEIVEIRYCAVYALTLIDVLSVEFKYNTCLDKNGNFWSQNSYYSKFPKQQKVTVYIAWMLNYFDELTETCKQKEW